MTETINKEPVEGEPGAVEEPTQPPSEPQAEPSAVDEASLKAVLEPLVQDAFDRQQQSLKDKRFAKQENLNQGFENRLTRMESLMSDEGLSKSQALQYMKVEELLETQGISEKPEVPPVGEPAVQTQVASEDYLSPVLKMAGIDANDPDVIALLRDERDPAKQLIAIGALSESRKKTSPPVPGAALPSGDGKAVETETLESVTAALEAERAKPVRDREKFMELSEKHKKLLPRK